jgi:hypothetical protein
MKHPFWRKYRIARADAATRGIEFLFTFDEWLDCWERSGHLHERGRCKGQYQMARIGDTGPYAPWNVKICTIEENRAEQKMTKEHCSRKGSANGCAKLDEQKVRKMRNQFKKGVAIKYLSKIYGITYQNVWSAVRRKSWKHVA